MKFPLPPQGQPNRVYPRGAPPGLYGPVSVLAGAAQMSGRTWVGGALVVAAAAWSAWAAPGEDRAAAAQSAA